MDVGWFLHQRVGFIRQLYATSAAPYIERQRLIDAGEAPFEPPYSEDGEPPFLLEWQEADDSLHLLGYACVSTLSDTLKVFFGEWERLTGVTTDPATAKVFKKQGFVAGYRALFEQRLGVQLADSGVDLELLEQVVLVRNRVQHQDSLTMNRPSHSKAELARLKSPFFLDDHERQTLTRINGNGESVWLMPPPGGGHRAPSGGRAGCGGPSCRLDGSGARTLPERASSACCHDGRAPGGRRLNRFRCSYNPATR